MNLWSYFDASILSNIIEQKHFRTIHRWAVVLKCWGREYIMGLGLMVPMSFENYGFAYEFPYGLVPLNGYIAWVKICMISKGISVVVQIYDKMAQ